MCRVALSSVILAFVCASSACSAVEPITNEQAQAWMRYLCPLPKSIRITGRIVVPSGATPVVQEADNELPAIMAAKELRDVLGRGTHRATSPIKIVLRTGGPEVEPLKSLKNSDQAYRITTSPDGSNLTIAARTARGLYYGAKTLQQLLAAYAEQDTVTVPVLEVTDWPDMQTRGFWGADNFNHLKWLGSLKFNLCEQISDMGVDGNKRAYAVVKDGREPLVWEGPLYGIEFAPVVLHLEQSSQAGLIRAYPHFKGKSEHPGVLCYSQEGIDEVIAQWMVQLAKIPGVSTVDCWMTENLATVGGLGCRCEKCKDQKWQVLEARTIKSAWEKAKSKLGRDFTLRVTTAEAIEPELAAALAEFPPEVQIAYYHSLRTYNDRRLPIIPPPIEARAKAGGWVGVVPNLDSLTSYWQPFHGAAFVKYRMDEFVDKHLSGLIAYVTPRLHYYKFNVEAAAEWSWNSKGRSTREFAVSYAVRNGFKDPEKFADWSETLGPVAWHCYGSTWPAGERKKQPPPVAKRLRDGTLPEIGRTPGEFFPTPWGDIESEAQLDADVASAARALGLARELGMEELVQESLVVDGYIRSLKALSEIKKLVKGGTIAEKDRAEAAKQINNYVSALRQSQKALPMWERTVKTEPGTGLHSQTVIDLIDQIVAQMTDLAADMGVKL